MHTGRWSCCSSKRNRSTLDRQMGRAVDTRRWSIQSRSTRECTHPQSSCPSCRPIRRRNSRVCGCSRLSRYTNRSCMHLRRHTGSRSRRRLRHSCLLTQRFSSSRTSNFRFLVVASILACGKGHPSLVSHRKLEACNYTMLLDGCDGWVPPMRSDYGKAFCQPAGHSVSRDRAGSSWRYGRRPGSSNRRGSRCDGRGVFLTASGAGGP